MMFGSELTGVTDCPNCGEKIELSLNCSDLHSATESEPPAELSVQSNGGELRFRLPTSADLLAVSSPEALLERCLLSGGNHLTEDIVAAAAEKMSCADSMAD